MGVGSEPPTLAFSLAAMRFHYGNTKRPARNFLNSPREGSGARGGGSSWSVFRVHKSFMGDSEKK